jgi:AraC-like DNA-binding protein
VCALISQSVEAKPPTTDSLSSEYFKKTGEAYYQNGDYRQACENFIKANSMNNNIKEKKTIQAIFVFCLIDVLGLFLFLYLEKQRAYKKLVSKNMQWANQDNRFFDCKHQFKDCEDFDEKENQTIKNIIMLLESEKVYMRKELTISDLAKMLNTNRNIISKVTNTYFKKTLPALLNEYRIKEAVKLLIDDKTKNYKMEAISEMCGFNTRQVFHAAFKKETGITPNDFKKMSSRNDLNDD